MASNRNISVLKGTVTAKQEKQAMQELNARKSALLTWRAVATSLGMTDEQAYVWQVFHGKRPPTRRLLLALGIVKPEKRTGIRVRMSAEEARAIVNQGIVPVNVKNRIRYQMGAK